MTSLSPAVVQRSRGDRLTAIIAVQTELMASDLPPAEVLQLVVERVAGLTNASGGMIEMQEEDALVFRAACGLLSDSVGLRVPIARSLSGWCLETGLACRCDDTETDPRVNRPMAQRLGVRSLVLVPLRHAGERVGVLKIVSSHPAFFGEADQETLELLAGFIAAAIARGEAEQMERALIAERERAGRMTAAQAELKQRLVVAERMASLGTLAAGVAHEINNPLAFTVSSLSFAGSEVEYLLETFAQVLPAQVQESLGEIRASLREGQQGAARVAAIVRDLKSFARADGASRDRVDLREVAQSALHLVAGHNRSRASLTVELGAVPPLLANAPRLGQVVLNLIVNAVQAMPAERRAEENRVTVRTGCDEAGRATLEVEDNGRGMTPEVQAQIFDPFFTTKPIGEGTGLGLSVSHSIVSDHGGAISVRSEPGVGTRFRITLPSTLPADRPAEVRIG